MELRCPVSKCVSPTPLRFGKLARLWEISARAYGGQWLDSGSLPPKEKDSRWPLLSHPSPCGSASCLESVSSVSLSPRSGPGRQQASGQEEAHRREPGEEAEGGAAEIHGAQARAHWPGMGAHQDRHRGSRGHQCPGQPLEAEAEVPGKTPPLPLPLPIHLWLLGVQNPGCGCPPAC